jgi:hypothetical protein
MKEKKDSVQEITEKLKAIRIQSKYKLQKKTIEKDISAPFKKLYLSSLLPKIIVTDPNNLTRTLSGTELHLLITRSKVKMKRSNSTSVLDREERERSLTK